MRTGIALAGHLKPVFTKSGGLYPEKTDVLIWDVNGSGFLSRYVLYDIDHSILHTRMSCIMRFRISGAVWKFATSILSNTSTDKEGDDLLLLYYLACFEHINPKVILTFVDNDIKFHRLSNRYPAASFFAIQNGCRAMNETIDYSPSDLKVIFLETGDKYTVTNFICFGEFEVNFYKKLGATIKRYHPVGGTYRELV